MTLVDLIKSIIDSSKERIKTPIVGAFICSFIIYNWRPIFLLLFSEKSIEDKILIINSEYCSKSAFWSPLLIALIYTVFIPFVMIIIDAVLVYAKKQRVINIYQDKKNILDEEIKIAGIVLELKNAESGNKEKQDLLDQIETLKESNLQITQSSKNTIDQLNNELKTANNTIQTLKDFGDNSYTVEDKIRKITNLGFSKIEKEILHRFDVNKNDRIVFDPNYPVDIIEGFMLLNILRKENNYYYVTDFGKDYFRRLGFQNKFNIN